MDNDLKETVSNDLRKTMDHDLEANTNDDLEMTLDKSVVLHETLDSAASWEELR